MCGITGFVYPPSGHKWDPRAALRSMVGSLAHRGPDDEGMEVDEAAGLFMGFRRLAILDLSAAGHQPMVSASGRYVITFNGEIYNFLDLRRELEADGFAFTGRSDTEVMLAAFERWGCENAVRRFRGMFAFGLWDRRERLLWLARDRMGIKPLYVLRKDGGLAYASEARVFHCCPMYNGAGSRSAALGYLRRLHVVGPASILEGVDRIEPGSLLCYEVTSSGAVERSRTRYWDLPRIASAAKEDPVGSEAEALESLLDLLRESVRLRLIADVPVGALLSGGVDSSLIVGIMQELSTAPVRTFTISFSQPGFDEAPVAERVARHLGTAHTTVGFSADEIIDLVPNLAGLSDEPMANPSLLPTLLISEVARRDVVVALSGDGGDELFGGYNRYLQGARAMRVRNRLPSWVRGLGAGVLGQVARRAGSSAMLARLKPASMGDQQSPGERLMKLAGVLNAATNSDAYDQLLSVGMVDPPLRRESSAGDRPSVIELGDEFDLEELMMLHDQMHYLPDDLLTKVDRASMWESLEARVPILDQEVVKFSWRLPTSIKFRGGVPKWPLRQLAQKYVPASLLDRPKMGFTAPVTEWLGGSLRDWSRDTLGAARVRDVGLLDPSGVDRLWKQFDAGRTDLALPLWSAAVLHSWSEAWGVRF
ncbi:MAG: asparagine synthase (glutamine-hydrolyzing) [Longimicrobiales bacterium]